MSRDMCDRGKLKKFKIINCFFFQNGKKKNDKL